MFIKDSAKTILCYGDSNTWGANPVTYDRYPRNVRWTSLLSNLLGEDYEVINEGLCGRTFVAEDPKKLYRTGITHLSALLQTHDPVELVIIMLGTNDVKSTYNLKATDIAKDLEQTIELIKSDEEVSKVPEILIVCPPSPIEPEKTELDPRMLRAPEIFKTLPGLFQQVAIKHGCHYLNSAEIISSSTIDGYHLDPEAHQALAKKLAEIIPKIIK